ncbi:hypothetical protein BHM03_00048183 [Ensete ventricosum]|nr:hypothetical protein BHM03_00048183 [Ensete ventricosum]
MSAHFTSTSASRTLISICDPPRRSSRTLGIGTKIQLKQKQNKRDPTKEEGRDLTKKRSWLEFRQQGADLGDKKPTTIPLSPSPYREIEGRRQRDSSKDEKRRAEARSQPLPPLPFYSTRRN